MIGETAFLGRAMHEIRSSILGGSEKPATPVASKSKTPGEAGGLSGLTRIAIKRQETRVTNQRAEDRMRNVVEETTIVFRRRKVQARVVNVSSRGAMIEADVDARIGEKIDIQFTEKNRTKCIVRWLREGRIGIEFQNETIFWDSAAPGTPIFHYENERPEGGTPREVLDRQPRQTLLRSGTLYWSGISIPVRLRNISSTGARLESDQEIRAGCEVELDLGEAGFQFAEVRWAKDGQVGLRFATDFDLDSLSPKEAAPASPATDMLKPAYLETETRPDSPWAARFERLTLQDLQPPTKP